MHDPPVALAARCDSYRGDQSEDRLVCVPLSDGWILAVADGVGGRAGGALAAAAAVGHVRVHAESLGTGLTDWSGFLVYIDSEVSEVADGGETTLIVLEATSDYIKGASAGDSEAWFVTADAVFNLTEYQERKPFVGTGDAVPMSFNFRIPAAGGTLIVASDGLFGHVSAAEISRLARLSDAEDVAKHLVNAARGHMTGALPDDIAVVICQFPRTAGA